MRIDSHHHVWDLAVRDQPAVDVGQIAALLRAHVHHRVAAQELDAIVDVAHL